MPATDVIYFRELDGSVPMLEWLREIARRDRRAAEKCVAQIGLLRDYGHELRRPLADYLRDGIYELRIRVAHVQYRILYFFYGQNTVVLTHGLTKEKKVPPGKLSGHYSVSAFSRRIRRCILIAKNCPMAKKKKRYITDAFEIAIRELGDTPALRARIEEEKLNIRVAQMIYEAREKTGLTQKQLAELIGTKQQVIARLEDADYEGHSLTMLQRIAAALGRKIELSMVPVKRRRRPA